jgi:hypothetical protein
MAPPKNDRPMATPKNILKGILIPYFNEIGR